MLLLAIFLDYGGGYPIGHSWGGGGHLPPVKLALTGQGIGRAGRCLAEKHQWHFRFAAGTSTSSINWALGKRHQSSMGYPLPSYLKAEQKMVCKATTIKTIFTVLLYIKTTQNILKYSIFFL